MWTRQKAAGMRCMAFGQAKVPSATAILDHEVNDLQAKLNELYQAFFLDISKKTQGQKNSSRKKTQANFRKTQANYSKTQ